MDYQNRIIGSGEEHPDQILANPKNWRVHPKHQQNAMQGALEELGWIQQIIVNQRTGTLIDGHLRVSIALRNNAETIPVVYVDLSEDEEKLALATLDPIAAMAGTDKDKLTELLQSIETTSPGLQDLLAEIAETEGILDMEEEKTGNTDDDSVPACPKKPTTEPGDIWVLGQHRLICGDATDTKTAERLLQGERPDLIWTDPPYNVDYEGGTGMKIQNDKMGDAAFFNFLLDAFSAAAYFARPGAGIYVAHADSNGGTFRAAFTEAGFLLKQCLIWVKNSLVLGRQDYQWKHEPILYGWKPGAAHYFTPDRSLTTVHEQPSQDWSKWKKEDLVEMLTNANDDPGSVIYWDKPTRSELHPTMKPVGLVKTMIKNSSKPADIVLDLFGGSGTTLIACEKTNRAARLIELDPIFADVIVQRWQEWTGETAILQGSGDSFEEAKKKRADA